MRTRLALAAVTVAGILLPVLLLFQPTHRAAAGFDLPLAGDPRIDAGELDCLALTMYWEARGEGRRGMEAVGSVVLNRRDDKRFPNTVCGVVREGGPRPGCQFSYYCDGLSDRPRNSAAWHKARQLAKALLAEPDRRSIKNALFYHADYIAKPWRVARSQTARVGKHIFYY